LLTIAFTACTSPPPATEPSLGTPPAGKLDGAKAKQEPPPPVAKPKPQPKPMIRHAQFTLGEPIVAWSHSDDFTLLAATGKTRVAVWDTSTGWLRGLANGRNIGDANRVAIAVSSGPHALVVWTGEKLKARAHTALALAAPLDPARDAGVTHLGKLTSTVVQPPAQGCRAAAISSLGLFVDGCDNRHLHFFKPPQVMFAAFNVNHGVRPEALAFSPDGKLLAVAGNGLGMRSGVDGSLVHHPLSAYQKVILSARFTPDGRYVITGWHSGISVYDVAKKKWLVNGRLKTFPGWRARHLDISADGKYIVIGGDIVRTADLLTLRERYEIKTLNAKRLKQDVLFAGDGKHLWVAHADGTIKLVDRATLATFP